MVFLWKFLEGKLENKFDLSLNNIKLLSDNYLSQFYEFLSPNFDLSKSGRIWNGTLQKSFIKIILIKDF